MKIFKIILPVIVFLFLTSCLEPSYHLQRLQTDLIPSTDAHQIEKDYKNRYGEIGVTFSGKLAGDTGNFRDSSYYGNPKIDNCKIYSPQFTLNVHGAILGEHLISGYFELQSSIMGSRQYFSTCIGPGVRMYKNSIAGRAFALFGLSHAFSDVEVFAKGYTPIGSTQGTGDYDLIDSYWSERFFFGGSINFNTTAPMFINPFVNIRLFYHHLFKFEDISISAYSASAAMGIYKKTGPVTTSLGMQFDIVNVKDDYSFQSTKFNLQCNVDIRGRRFLSED
jgi:hypothetical protein